MATKDQARGAMKKLTPLAVKNGVSIGLTRIGIGWGVRLGLQKEISEYPAKTFPETMDEVTVLTIFVGQVRARM